MTMKSWLAAVALVGVVAGAASTVSPSASASVQLPQRSDVTKATSADWAGYAALADKGKRFRYVAADFIIPGLGCNTTDTPGAWVTASQWIGLDGYNHGTAEQIGVSETCEQDVPYISYGAWYRGASGSGHFLGCFDAGGGCPMGPNPGDRVQLSVYFNGKTYRLIYHDVTAKVYRKFHVRCAKCRNKSAEVINQVNSVSDGAGVYAVNFFGVRVTSATGRRGTVAPQPRNWATAQIFMVGPARTNVAYPSALLRQGRAFHVYGS